MTGTRRAQRQWVGRINSGTAGRTALKLYERSADPIGSMCDRHHPERRPEHRLDQPECTADHGGAVVPDGLMESLRADAILPVRPAEVARVRRRLAHVSLDDEEVLHGIATKLLLVSSPG